MQLLSGDARRAVFAPLDDGALRSEAVVRRVGSAIALGLLGGRRAAAHRDRPGHHAQRLHGHPARGAGGAAQARAGRDPARPRGRQLRAVPGRRPRRARRRAAGRAGHRRTCGSSATSTGPWRRPRPGSRRPARPAREIARLRDIVDRLARAESVTDQRRAEGRYFIELAACAQSVRLTMQEMDLHLELGQLPWPPAARPGSSSTSSSPATGRSSTRSRSATPPARARSPRSTSRPARCGRSSCGCSGWAAAVQDVRRQVSAAAAAARPRRRRADEVARVGAAVSEVVERRLRHGDRGPCRRAASSARDPAAAGGPVLDDAGPGAAARSRTARGGAGPGGRAAAGAGSPAAPGVVAGRPGRRPAAHPRAGSEADQPRLLRLHGDGMVRRPPPHRPAARGRPLRRRPRHRPLPADPHRAGRRRRASSWASPAPTCPVRRFETHLLRVLGRLPAPFLLLNDEDRVVLSTAPRWLVGSLLPPGPARPGPAPPSRACRGGCTWWTTQPAAG